MNGYEDTSFIAGMSEEELVSIGVTKRTHLSALMTAISLLPELEATPNVPVNQ